GCAATRHPRSSSRLFCVRTSRATWRSQREPASPPRSGEALRPHGGSMRSADSPVFTTREAAAFCDVTLTVFKSRFVGRGIPRIQLGRLVRYHRDDLIKWKKRYHMEVEGRKAAQKIVDSESHRWDLD